MIGVGAIAGRPKGIYGLRGVPGNKGPEGFAGGSLNGSTLGSGLRRTGSYGIGRGRPGLGRAGSAKPREKGLATIFLSVRSLCLAERAVRTDRPALLLV